MLYDSEKLEQEAVFAAAKLMVAAARTAPKTKGVDNILTLVVDGAEKDAIAAEMRRLGAGNEKSAFTRDAGNVDDSDCVVLLAVCDNPAGLPGCDVCGFENCAAAKAAGSPCAFNISDLGTAACSACAVASHHWIDNRLMYTAGTGARMIDLFGEKVRLAYGIPLSVKGKSIYYDRK